MENNLILFIIIFLWIFVLTGILIWVFIFFLKLSKSVGGKENLIKTLNKILDVQNKNTDGISDLKKNTQFLKDDGEKHTQKVGLVKYNPFAEMGGDHSFSISLLDGHNSGLILTALHTRDRTRLYVKEIDKGKSKIELSEHEKKSIEKAK